MDVLSFLGLGIAVASIVGTMLLEGGSAMSLIHAPAFVVVIGGTFGAVLVQTPLRVFTHAFKMLPWVFLPPRDDSAEVIEQIVEWSQVARRDGVLALEPIAEEQTEPFIKGAIGLVVDGIPPATMRAILENKLTAFEEYELQAARVFDQMAGYSPTIGIIGAVLGLINVMAHLDDPSHLGSGIATAFVATIYGVGTANILYLPIANKLRLIIRRHSRRLEIIIEGLLGIATAEPRLRLSMRLTSFLHDGATEPEPSAEEEGNTNEEEEEEWGNGRTEPRGDRERRLA
jgi:chemotaxis protein MotA